MEFPVGEVGLSCVGTSVRLSSESGYERNPYLVVVRDSKQGEVHLIYGSKDPNP